MRKHRRIEGKASGGAFLCLDYRVDQYLYSLCEEAGIGIKKSSHKISKTFISSLFATGLNMDKIREIAGHEDERTSLNNYCFETKTDKESERILDGGGFKLNIADII